MATKDKAKTVYVCEACGAETAKWAGRCEACGEWNTMKETAAKAPPKGAPARQGYAGGGGGEMTTLAEVTASSLVRYPTGLSEFDRVLGGGLVAGGTVLIGGNPGAGKSTLLLQTGCVTAEERPVCYFTGEESLEQLKDRGERLRLPLGRMQATVETDVVQIGAVMERDRPRIAIVDSIQTMFHPELESEPGGVSQVKTCAAYLNRVAKRLGTSLLLVGHITKDGDLAGPRALEHIVDASLIFRTFGWPPQSVFKAQPRRVVPEIHRGDPRGRADGPSRGPRRRAPSGGSCGASGTTRSARQSVSPLHTLRSHA